MQARRQATDVDAAGRGKETVMSGATALAVLLARAAQAAIRSPTHVWTARIDGLSATMPAASDGPRPDAA